MKPLPSATKRVGALPSLAAAALLAFSAVEGWAQEASPAPTAGSSTRAWVLAQQWRMDGDSAEFAAQELAGQRVVKGAPFCADAVHEAVQWLPDPQGGPANRIVQQQSSRLCRDGEGRVRQEVERAGQRRVYLHDPVAQESWALDPVARTARRLGVAETARRGGVALPVPPIDASAWREYGERMREWQRQLLERLRHLSPGRPLAPADGSGAGLPPSPPAMPPLPALPGATAGASAGAATAAPAPVPAPVLVQAQATVQTHAGDGPARPVAPSPQSPQSLQSPPSPQVGQGGPSVHLGQMGQMGQMGPLGQIELRILHLDPAARDQPPVPPGLTQRAIRLAPRGPGVTTALPSREQDGLRLDGERTSWTIEAGRIGNERPIVISREVWRSPELLLVITSRDIDPRSGETAYRLTNLKRGEPDAALMKVPPDYEPRGRPAPAARGAG
jgi:hypothetical protein